MRPFWAVTSMELRLIWRQPTFWMVEAIILIAPLISSYLTLTSSGFLGFFWPSFALIFSLIPILLLQAIFLPLIVAPAIRRDLERAGDLLWVTPLNAATHLFGVAAGLWLSFQPLFVAQTAMLWGLNHWFAIGESNLFWLYWLLALNASTSAWLGVAILAAMFVPRSLLLQILWVPLVIYIWLKIPFSSPFGSGEEPSILVVQYPIENPMLLALFGAGLAATLLALAASLLVDQRRALRLPFLAPTFLKREDSHGHSH